jgi:beta-N-acetylhexosaminidase
MRRYALRPTSLTRLPTASHLHHLMFSCCLIVLLSACTHATLAAQKSIVTPTKTTSATLHVISTVINESSNPTDVRLRQDVQRVQQIMQGMSLAQKLGQLILVEYLGNSYQGSGLQTMIMQQYVGGFMYQESNSNFDAPDDTVSSVAAFSQQAMQDASIPLLIATDQEGGLVNRLYRFHGYLPSAQEMAASGDPQYAQAQGAQDAQWMEQLGMNTDLAPDVDVQTVSPPILETRMFGSDPQTVATYAGAFLQGLQTNGVAGCLKHFPGLGAITSDPHTGLPTVNRSLSDLEQIDLAPYRLMIQQDQPAMIMATDVLMPAIDPTLPAELSPNAITGVLRDELGYKGVVITDGLYMDGISERWSLSQAAVLAIMAGDDMVEGPYTPAQVANVVAALQQALQQGQLTIDRINQSVARILLLKMQYGVIK